MNANHNGSGRSRSGAGSGSFLAPIHHLFGSGTDPGHLIYGKKHESR